MIDEGNVYSRVCQSVCSGEVPIQDQPLTLPPTPNMFKRVQLGPHHTGTPSPLTCSNLFTL